MKTKFNFRKSRVVYGVSTFLIAVLMVAVSCTKEAEVSTSNSSDSNGPSMLLLPNFIEMYPGLTSQNFSISCVCSGPLNLTSTNPNLQYSTISGTQRNYVCGSYTTTLNQNQYYYFIPVGLPYGASTKCLKAKFITWSTNPKCSYNPATNSWSGLGTTANYDVTQVNASTIPGCPDC